MPRKKRKLTELPDKEVIRRLFPKKVVEEVERVAHLKDNDNKRDNQPTQEG